MQRRQIAETMHGFRDNEGTRKGCFAPIRNGQILRHDGILSRYQVALRREGGPRSAAKWRPRHALCVFSRSASRAGVFVPRTGARRSSPGSLHRGRWPGCSSFGGWGRCGRLFSAPPMCQAGWSRSPGGWCRGWLLSGGDLNPPGPIGPPPASGGLAPPTRRRRIHDATPAAPSTASPGAHCCAYAPGNAPPAADFSECAPQGGHTPKNLTLFARLATHRAASGPEATPRTRRTPLPQSPRPFPVGKGGEGSRIRCGGDGGCSHRTACRLLRSWPTMISACHCRVKGRKNFPLEIFCFPP